MTKQLATPDQRRDEIKRLDEEIVKWAVLLKRMKDKKEREPDDHVLFFRNR